MFPLVTTLLSLGLVLGAPSTKHHVPTLDGRIVGGNDTDIATYPYQIAFFHYDYLECGGAIISPSWIVTAAHCIENFDSVYQVRAGSSQVDSGGETIDVSQITVHPNFNETLGVGYDIALLKLSKEITAVNATAISLPDIDNGNTTIPEGTMVTITGWGNMDENIDLIPDTLQVVEIPVVSQADCQNAYADFIDDGAVITDAMFCAGILETGGVDSCQGDSGGPAAVDGVLVGIVSWGKGCAEPHYPGVYTNVLVYRSWIKEITGL